MTARAPRLAWKMAEGCYVTGAPGYEAFSTQRFDGQWVALIFFSDGGPVWMSRRACVARHAVQWWAEAAIASCEMPADAIDIKAEAVKAAAAKAAAAKAAKS